MKSELKMDKDLPLVSVCIPAYNHEKYVANCIQSVIDQDYENIELIIINDGSTDNTHDVIMSLAEECKRRFVRFEYRNRENKGLPRTLNEMIEISRGEYIKFIASDDALYPNSIRKFIKKMIIENLDILYGRLALIDEEGNLIKVIEGLRLKRKFDFNDFNIETVLLSSPVFGSSWIIKREALIRIGCFNEISKIEDWDLHIRVILNNLKKGYTFEISSYYRTYKNKGPHFGSYLNWLREDLKIINQYRDINKKLYKRAVRNLFKNHFIRNRNYKNEEFIPIFKELITNYPFAISIFLDPVFLARLLLSKNQKKYIKKLLYFILGRRE